MQTFPVLSAEAIETAMARTRRELGESGWTHEERRLRRGREARYGLTHQQFTAMIFRQRYGCAVCQKSITEISCVVDHCHETGRVRGLLCVSCNSGLGQLGDNVEGLRRAIAYLEGCHAEG